MAVPALAGQVAITDAAGMPTPYFQRQWSGLRQGAAGPPGPTGATGPAGANGTNGTNGTNGSPAQFATTRAAFASLSGVNGEPRYLIDGDASGWFVWRAGDYAARVTADTLGGLYIAGAAATTSGAWVRDWDWIHGKPEWFGAVTGGPDCLAALNACVALCPVTLLETDDYWISDTWKITTNWRMVIGGGVVSYNRFEGTRVILADGSKRILQVGADTDPGGNPQTNYLRNVVVRDLTVARASTIVPNATVDLSPAAVWMQFTFFCEMYNVAGWESAIGFRLYGNVASKINKCWAFRSSPATTTVNDVAYGFYCVGDPPIFTGGNASLTMSDCKANCVLGAGTPSVAAGFRLQGSCADIYMIHPETTGYQIALQISGNAGGGGASSNINVHCIGGIFDQPIFSAIQVENMNATSMLTLVDCYAGVPGTAFGALYINNNLGRVVVTGGQFISEAGSADPLGIYINDSRGVTIDKTICTNFERPVFIEDSRNFDIQPVLNNQGVALSGAAGAVSLQGSSRGYVAPLIAGAATIYARGVDMAGTGNSLIEVNCSKIDADAITGGSGNKLVHNSVQITATGAFGTNCLASGVMA